MTSELSLRTGIDKRRRKKWERKNSSNSYTAAAKANRIESIKQLQLVCRAGDFCSLLWATRAQSTKLLHWNLFEFFFVAKIAVSLCLSVYETKVFFSFVKYVTNFHWKDSVSVRKNHVWLKSAIVFACARVFYVINC